jgi:hypothetical protein
LVVLANIRYLLQDLILGPKAQKNPSFSITPCQAVVWQICIQLINLFCKHWRMRILSVFSFYSSKRYCNFTTSNTPTGLSVKGILIDTGGNWVPSAETTLAYYLVEIGGMLPLRMTFLSAFSHHIPFSSGTAPTMVSNTVYNPSNSHYCIQWFLV